jgi:beta-lactamase regulating signal transducer with metallopeptidase domain
MAALLLYLAIVSALFSLAAIGTERACALRGWPRRFVWLVTIGASLGFPLAMALTTQQPVLAQSDLAPFPAPLPRLETLPAATAPPGIAAPRQTAPATRRASDTPVPERSARFDPTTDAVLLAAWALSCAGVIVWFSVLWVRFSIRVQRCPQVRLHGASASLTGATGPAVFGFLRPRILLPQWLLDSPSAQQRIVIAHEQQHIAARDPLWLLVALFLVALAPWNPVLWWQLKRLRFAIEADCDARVLKGGIGASHYAEVLLSVGRHRSPTPVGLMAVTEHHSALEQRVCAIMAAPGGQGGCRAALGLLLAFGIVAVAACVHAPGLAPHELRKRPSQDVKPAALTATSIARAQFPELFAQHFEGTAVVAVILNRDGSLNMVDKHQFAAGTAPSDFDLAAENTRLGVDAEEDVMYRGGEYGQWTIGPWLESKNPGRLFIVYEVLKWRHDPTRTGARVQAALAAYDPSLLIPQPEDKPANTIQVTVFMNDDGTINRESKREIPPGTPITEDDLERFAALGVKQEQLGRRGFALGFDSHSNSAVRIDYAWPKRSDDPPDIADSAIAWREIFAKYPERQDTEDDPAIFARYFPDIERSGYAAVNVTVQGGKQVLLPWILFGRDGHIWDSGRWPTNTDQFREGVGLAQELGIRYPGAKVSGQGSPCRFNRVPVACLWITADSPVQKLQDVDLRRRQDLLLTGAFREPLFFPEGFQPTFPDYLKVAVFDFATGLNLGATQTVSAMNGWHPLLKVTATAVNSRELEIRVSVPSYGVNISKEPSDWAQTRTVKVAYGEPAILTLSDAASNVPAHKVELILRAQRLRGT